MIDHECSELEVVESLKDALKWHQWSLEDEGKLYQENAARGARSTLDFMKSNNVNQIKVGRLIITLSQAEES